MSAWEWEGLGHALRDDKPLLVSVTVQSRQAAIDSGYLWAINLPGVIAIESLDQRLLNKIKTFILCDERTNFKLTRIFRPERCKFITYPPGYSNLHEIQTKFGDQAVIDLIRDAKDYPVVGLYRPDEFPAIPEALKTQYSTCMGYNHDFHIKILLGKFMVITGYPSHGKSEWADCLVLNLAKRYDWSVCVCSAEIDNEEYEENTIRRYLRRPMDQVGKHEPAKAKKFYQDHYVFITNNTMNVDLELSLEKLVELAKIAIIRHGCKVLLVDPWNELEHKHGPRESETEYTGRAIRLLKSLAKQYHILVIVVAHPAKPMGQVVCPSLYSISGSANWYNKADYGIVINRPDTSGNSCEIRIVKIKRHGPMGKPGTIYARLNNSTRHFEEDQ